MQADRARRVGWWDWIDITLNSLVNYGVARRVMRHNCTLQVVETISALDTAPDIVDTRVSWDTRGAQGTHGFHGTQGGHSVHSGFMIHRVSSEKHRNIAKPCFIYKAELGIILANLPQTRCGFFW